MTGFIAICAKAWYCLARMKNYILELGRNWELCHAEIAGKCTEVFADEKLRMVLVNDVKFENPRDLPKKEEQLFLDRLGGCIRMAEVIGEFREKGKMIEMIYDIVKAEQPEGKPKVGVSGYGTGKGFLPNFLSVLKQKFGELRVENAHGENMTSGQAFDRKLLKRGFEFIVWQNGDSFVLGRTRAMQNLRNYTLRDRKKSFRDSEMGMLPPKLAQQLINLTGAPADGVIVDPFCGSGTICSEAAIAGWKTVGSDMVTDRVKGAKENFKFLAEKFRYEETDGTFMTKDSTEFVWGKVQKAYVATEGFLGENFGKRPTRPQAEKQAFEVLKMWDSFWHNAKEHGPRCVAVCIPHWHLEDGDLDILEKFLALAAKVGYTPRALFDKKTSALYERPGAFVAREVVVLEKKPRKA